MLEPGSGAPPTITAPQVTCSVTGKSNISFSVFKQIAGSILEVLLSDEEGNTVWSDVYGVTVNSRSYNVAGQPNGKYTLEASNGEGTSTRNITINCTASSTCDLSATVVATRASASNNLGYAEVNFSTTHPPVEFTWKSGPRTGKITTTYGEYEYLSLLVPGAYSIELTDAAGCTISKSFIVAPAAVTGCTDATALNYNPNATVDDNSCVFAPKVITGCMNPRANNYNPDATQEDGSCQFGIPDASFEYSSVTLVFSEPESKWVTEQTSQPQMLLPLDGRHVHALPLPGQSADGPTTRYLWEHNAGPEIVLPAGSTAIPGVLLYGLRHKTWIEVIVLGMGVHTIKNLDNLVLAGNDEMPARLTITAPEQGSFSQLLIDGRTRLATVDRQEQLTYVQLTPPEDKPWGGRVRAPYIRLRIDFAGRKQLRLSKLFALLRESLT